MVSDVTVDLRDSLQAALAPAYTLDRELGGGGMSRVFVAQDTALNRPVVVKALLPTLASGVSAQRFAREVHAAATLQSPHIVPVLSAGQTADEIPYYIMPFVRGETLRVRLTRGRIPYAEAVQLLGDVAKALAAAHEADMVHRDVKPDNILLTGGAASVTDFGIAHAIHEARAETIDPMLTTTGTSLGTPAYMAPEQACGDAIDARTDVYAWGVVAYEMIAGHHPFPTAHTAQRLIAAQIAERPLPLSTHQTGTPAWFCKLVMSCLAKEPDLRPADGGTLVHAVEYGEAARPFVDVWTETFRKVLGRGRKQS
jgi:serine/threonine-protein kinase